MSVTIATMGMFRQCCGTPGGGGGAPPVYQYEARAEDFPISVKVKRVKLLDPKEADELIIKVTNVYSDRQFDD